MFWVRKKLSLWDVSFEYPQHMFWLRNKKIIFLVRPLKGIYLSKALSCMKLYSCIYKQKLLFYQGDGYLWPHYCMNNLYISHRSLYAPTYSFWAIGSMLISLFRHTSWFDTVYNIVTRWVNLRENHLHEHELQLSDYNISSILSQILCISGIYLQFFNLTLKNS